MTALWPIFPNLIPQLLCVSYNGQLYMTLALDETLATEVRRPHSFGPTSNCARLTSWLQTVYTVTHRYTIARSTHLHEPSSAQLLPLRHTPPSTPPYAPFLARPPAPLPVYSPSAARDAREALPRGVARAGAGVGDRRFRHLAARETMNPPLRLRVAFAGLLPNWDRLAPRGLDGFHVGRASKCDMGLWRGERGGFESWVFGGTRASRVEDRAGSPRHAGYFTKYYRVWALGSRAWLAALMA